MFKYPTLEKFITENMLNDYIRNILRKHFFGIKNVHHFKLLIYLYYYTGMNTDQILSIKKENLTFLDHKVIIISIQNSRFYLPEEVFTTLLAAREREPNILKIEENPFYITPQLIKHVHRVTKSSKISVRKLKKNHLFRMLSLTNEKEVICHLIYPITMQLKTAYKIIDYRNSLTPIKLIDKFKKFENNLLRTLLRRR